MSLPTTPSKADDPIERAKQSLTANWGIKFPPRDPVASPSKRDSNAIDERIHSYIQYLYYSKSTIEGATPLNFTLAEFDQEAPNIISSWQFKPRAETGVIPTRSQTDSSLRRDFLHRRNELPDSLSKKIDGISGAYVRRYYAKNQE